MRWSDNRTEFVEIAEARPYLYRVVDKYGKTVDSLLCADRSMFATEEFVRKVVARRKRWPRRINLDGNAASHRKLRLLRKRDPRWRSVVVRSHRYLNNIVEQDHRAIKRHCVPMLGLKSFRTASITLAGVELAQRIRKRQFSIIDGNQHKNPSPKRFWEQALAQHYPVN